MGATRSGPAHLSQTESALAWGTSSYLAAWVDARHDIHGEGLQVYATRLNASGEVLDSTGIRLSTGSAAARFPQGISIAADSTGFLVTWTEALSSTTGNIMARRVPPFGAPVKPEFRIQMSGAPTARPQLACATKTCLVAWHSPDSDPSWDALVGNYVETNNVVLPEGASSRLVGRGPLEQDLAVSFDGTHFLVVLSTSFNSPGKNIRRVYAKPKGTSPDAPYIDPFPISGWAPGLRTPSVAFDGTNHVVAWMEGSQVRATRVSPDGVVLDTSPWEVSPVESSLEQRPTVVSDGSSSLVLWASRPFESSARNRIHGARTMAFDSTPGAPQVLASAPWSDTFAAGTSMKPGQFLVGYSRFEGPPHGAHRLFTRKARYNSAPRLNPASCVGPEGFGPTCGTSPGRRPLTPLPWQKLACGRAARPGGEPGTLDVAPCHPSRLSQRTATAAPPWTSRLEALTHYLRPWSSLWSRSILQGWPESVASYPED
ncbi:hypothetical protein [Myxococcus stipitatus]|uniref:hypothetical protein n=1 Tax=Myxococcus stipitatus TaxID=83455 RepID=UPI000302076E|nr:hypothetical protein [Myxococcus stipitatus]